MKKIQIFYTLLIIVSVLSLGSCTSDNNQGVSPIRLFSPVLRSPLSAPDNTVVVNLSNLTDAVSYRVEISMDNFVTVIGIDSVNPLVTFKDLEWGTSYKVRASALASNAVYNSKVAEIGSITTSSFPNIIKPILPATITTVQAKIEWTITGNPVTTIKIYKAESLPVVTPKTIALATPFSTTNNDVPSTGAKTVTGLTSATAYVVAIYSDSVLRGYGSFTTKP